ncbi:MAG: hypothetical protein KC713_04220 [Candidatus Omnitrophica bacterium]|nr:hypothetical protein [Candidatus Omnitrophota bacterium]
MSLKGVHIVFIAACILLSLFFASWSIQQYNNTHALSYMLSGICSMFLSVSLIVYAIQFYRKVN